MIIRTPEQFFESIAACLRFIAEQQRKLEQEATADADNAYRNKMGLSPEQYLARQLAEIQAEACKKAVACYMVPQGTNVVAK